MKRALLIGVGMMFFPALALAQSSPPPEAVRPSSESRLDPDAPPPSVHIVEDAEPEAPFVPRERDLLGSHVLIGAGVGPTWSLGRFGSDLRSERALGTGFAVRADAAYGLSRYIAVGLWGTFAGYTDGDSCADGCSGRALAVGPFVRYHLAQGLRFDPWLTLGAGYRQVNFDNAAGLSRKLKGMEWLHLELGADYYLLSGLGLGPYAGIGLSTFSKRPADAGDARVSTELSVGLRFLLDLPGR